MTDRSKKITELSTLTTTSADDLLIVVDSPANNAITKKITVGNFFGNTAIPISTRARVDIANTLTVTDAADFGAVYVDGSMVINSSGSWVGTTAGFKGEKGDAGPAGTAGANGAAGAAGAKGQKGEQGVSVTLDNPQNGDIFFYYNGALKNWSTHYNISSILPSSRQYELSVNDAISSNTMLLDGVVDPDLYSISGVTISFNIISLPTGSGVKIGNNTYGVASVNAGEALRHVALDGTISYGAAAQNKNSGTLYFNIPHESSGIYKIFTTDEQQFIYIYVKNVQDI